MISGTDWSRIDLFDGDGDPIDENSDPANLLKYFPLSQDKTTPLNLGLYYDGENVYSTQYIGLTPLVNRKSREIEGGKYIRICSRFFLSPIEMLHEVISGMDCYDNSQMLTYGEYTLSELGELQSQRLQESRRSRDAEGEKILFGVVKGTHPVSIPHESGGQNRDMDQNSDTEENDQLDAAIGNEQSVFEILRFVSKAKELCRKNLKRQSQTQEENLTGKVKGRILMQKQIKYNLARGQYHKTYCAFNAMRENTIENRIIKYTLYLCGKSPLADFLNEDIAYCNRVLENVPLCRCSVGDFAGLKANAAYRQYQGVLALAKKILDRFYLSYERSPESGETRTVFHSRNIPVEPYFIDMNLLFEYYCRAIFREAIDQYNAENRDSAQYNAENQNNAADQIKLYLEPAITRKEERKRLFAENSPLRRYYMDTYIPDILIRDKRSGKPVIVADAKYSNVREQWSEQRTRTHQILFYMNALDCAVGGLIGFDSESDDEIIEGKYLCDGKEGDKTLFYLPIRDVTTNEQSAGSKTEYYVNAVKAALEKWFPRRQERESPG